MKALIDTCIIIDALQNRQGFAENAQKIFLMAANRKFGGYISAKSVTDIYYIMHRHFHDDKQTRSILNKLLIIFGIMDTTGEDCRNALISEISDFEDAVMVRTARRSDADCIITRNVKDYSRSDVKICTPEEFIDLIGKEKD
ncbi:MAG: PIN domain-containing protein [Oscillospiraceae bacterium]|nr:PIN domain-containing protein [Oscillospiraceae bacterium]